MNAREMDAALEAIKTSMAAKLPGRVVTRSLVLDPPTHDMQELRKGVICLVGEGGGRFANYRGREGQMGHIDLGVVGFVAVDEAEPTEAIERAELALLEDVLAWVKDPGAPRVFDTALPGRFRLSRQIDFPLGWIVLDLDVKP